MKKPHVLFVFIVLLFSSALITWIVSRNPEQHPSDDAAKTVTAPPDSSASGGDDGRRAAPHDHAHEHSAQGTTAPTQAERVADANPGFADALARANKGDAFAFTLPGGRQVSGAVNVVTLRPDGTRYVGGKLDGWRRASFFFSLKDGSPPGGDVLIFDDERAFVITDGVDGPVWQEKHIGEVICYPYPPAPDEPVRTQTSFASGQPAPEAAAAAPTPRATPVPAYESRPGAPVVLLLVFDGAIVEGTRWNSLYNDGDPIVAPPSTLSSTQIHQVWQRASEDYAPFNINVTTDPAAYARAAFNHRIRCIISPDYSWYERAGGVATVGVVGDDGDMLPCWVFNPSVDGIAEAVSHEIGHTFGLRHDGRSPPDTTGVLSSADGGYYYGHGGSSKQQISAAPMSWGTIMGASYYTSVNQWSKGEYPLAKNIEQKNPDDIHLIATKIPTATPLPGYVDDGIGATVATATPLAISGTSFVTQAGVITSAADANYHRLVLPASRTVVLRAAPAVAGVRIPNLNIALELQDAVGGTLVTFGTSHTEAAGATTANKTFNTLSATGTLENLATGTYFIKITGCGFKDPAIDGFSSYGSIGHYLLNGSIDAPLADDTATPVITAQPAAATLAYAAGALAVNGDPGAPLTLTVTAAGAAAPLTYLWHKDDRPFVNTTRADGAAISGATADTLAIANPSPADSGDYFVLVTDANGRTLASQTATVSFVAPPAPSITMQPANYVLPDAPISSSTATFSVTADSDAPLYYQWLKDGLPLNASGRYSGVTTGTLKVSSLTSADITGGGDSPKYSVRVSNVADSVTSASAGIEMNANSPALSVTPATRSVGVASGSTTFAVANTGEGTLPWTAAVTAGGGWARITSGSTGTNAGTITLTYEANPPGGAARTAKIEITAPGATGSPATVSLVQAANSRPPALVLTPSIHSVGVASGSTTFTVTNAGEGTLAWSASMASGAPWARINSGSTGIAAGTITGSGANIITVAYDANAAGSAARAALLNVTAPGATGSPASGTLAQNANPLPPTLTVTLDPQGGDLGAQPATKTVTRGQSYGALPSPSRAGHLFAGWWTAPGGGGAQVSPNTAVPAGAANHTLRAKWAAVPPGADGDYLIIDLSAGPNATNYPVSTSAAPPADIATNAACRTTELWLRRVTPGSFTMGSPANETGRYPDETAHTVTLTQPYHIGLFEITQKQWHLVMGAPPPPPSAAAGDTRPVENISYNDIRGASAGAGWPASDAVDADSFIGKLRAKTGRLFDLPTEAQWEYAARAGTTTALNNGANLADAGADASLDALGRYAGNKSDGQGGHADGQTTVGAYLPNAWGLHDTHGNVQEFCLDWHGALAVTPALDPKGAISGTERVLRGGSWSLDASEARSAARDAAAPVAISADIGLRIVVNPSAALVVAPAAPQTIATTADTLTFTITNTGSGAIPWTAALSPGADWARIISGASGTGDGTLTVACDANSAGGARRSVTLVITTANAENSPLSVTIEQAADTTTSGNNNNGGTTGGSGGDGGTGGGGGMATLPGLVLLAALLALRKKRAR
ncbi:MAG: SUMF1/EgtB/PvdO family nonheme iron enzyme [Opitutaceae bacterium]|jgi:uncharacterized repeat protein (TIGR02543 family)|nr:SUMF1/EgtB/PvdO family nonheme iron enzyme [Opitutaceae bacterium]